MAVCMKTERKRQGEHLSILSVYSLFSSISFWGGLGEKLSPAVGTPWAETR